MEGLARPLTPAPTTGQIPVGQPDIRCYRCSGHAAGQCPQCRRPFCKDHGNRLCLDCRRAGGTLELRMPLSGLPSSWIGRAVMLAIAAAIILLAWDSYRWVATTAAAGSRTAVVAQAPPAPPSPAAQGASQTPQPTRQGETTHVVAEGELLSQIAERYGITTQQLASYNNLANPNDIRVGQTLRIPPR